ncbi:sulfatase-like hydrolase/transferase [Persicobacter psychrovividus]|uniref:Acetylglucosamine-6-sulfatase n=1 Tax=Persicobacter psychrovividus TaxID=387638 RepID=A0ABN6LFJ6_9BACT|nr:acetylglucosamine-6-sulfatase [Persicobacter psychrovividus]
MSVIKYLLTPLFLSLLINAHAQEQPNIIFLMTDDQRWDNLGCYGKKEFVTPNIDALAEKGVVFDKAYYAVAICMPSRVTMMTGRYNSNHQVGFVAPTDYTLSQKDFQNSYPAQFKKAGYRTGFIGKVGFTVTEQAKRPSTPTKHYYKQQMGEVFDFFAGSETTETKGHVIWPENDAGLKQIYDTNRKNSGRTLRTGEAMLRFLETQPQDQPFCLSVSFYAVKHDHDSHIYWPHHEQFESVEMSVPDNWVVENEVLPKVVRENARGVRLHKQRSSTPEKYQRLVRRFATQGYSVDAQVGKLVDYLKKQNLLENTIIIYTSDNGRFQGAHGLFDKCLLYDESVKAPLIVYDGRATVRPYRDSALISSVDIAPTMLSLAGLKIPASMQGRDFSGLMNGQQNRSNWRDAVFFEDLFVAQLFNERYNEQVDLINDRLIENNKSYRSHGIRTGRYKYFRYYEHFPVIEELYDLQEDPLEQNNLAHNSAYFELLKQMRKRTDQLYEQAHKKASKAH